MRRGSKPSPRWRALVVAGVACVLAPPALAGGSGPEGPSPVGPPPLGDVTAYVAALAALLLPVVAGLLTALAVRRLVRWRRGADSGTTDRCRGFVAGLVLLLAPLVLLLLPPLSMVRVGIWDRLLTGLLSGFGVFVGAHQWPVRIDLRSRIILAVSTLVALLLLEAGARLLLPPAPTFEEPWECRLVLAPWGEYAMEEEACKMLHPEEFPDRMRGRLRGAEGASRRVLHVGDSLVYMTEPGGLTFPEILSRMEPGTAHINAGVPGMGPDYYYALMRSWLERLPVDLVVMHLFIGNDLGDLDDVRTCSDLGPLLEYNGNPASQAVLRHSGVVWGDYLGPPFFASPPPYALRVACGFSVAARNLQKLYYQVAEALLNPFDEAAAWAHLDAILSTASAELVSRGIPLVLVLMPHRPWLTDERYREGDDAIRLGIERIASRLGIRLLVPWEDFRAAVEREGIERWFLDGVEDNHFSTAGHRWMAEWLKLKL